MVQGGAGCAIQFNLGLLVDSHGADQIQFRQSEIALGRESLVTGSGSQFLFLLGDVEGALGEVARLAGCLDAGSSLLERKLGVAHFDADLLAQLLEAQFGLAKFKFRTVLVGLRDSISNGDIQIQPNVIIRSSAAECILHSTAEIGGNGGTVCPMEGGIQDTGKAGSAIEADQR